MKGRIFWWIYGIVCVGLFTWLNVCGIDELPRGYKARPYNNLGVAYIKERHDLDMGIWCFEEALRIAPNYGHAISNLRLAIKIKLILREHGFEQMEGYVPDTPEHLALIRWAGEP